MSVLLLSLCLLMLQCVAWMDGEPVPLLVSFRDGDHVLPPQPLPHALQPRFGIDRVVDLHQPQLKGFNFVWDARMQLELGHSLRRKTTWIMLRTAPKRSRFDDSTHAPKQLIEIHIHFGFERRIEGRLTDFRYVPTYASPNASEHIRLRYTWHTTHDYDTHSALTAVYVLSTGLFVWLWVIITSSSGTGKLKLLVRDRAE